MADMMQIQKQLMKMVLDIVESDNKSKASVKFKKLVKMIRSPSFQQQEEKIIKILNKKNNEKDDNEEDDNLSLSSDDDNNIDWL